MTHLSPPVARRLGAFLASTPGRSWDWRLALNGDGAVVAILSERGAAIEAVSDSLEGALIDALDIALGAGGGCRRTRRRSFLEGVGKSMGACGCGDYRGGKRFPGPPGYVYTLEIYPGCDDCQTPAGIVLHRFEDNEDDRTWYELDEPLKFLDWQGEANADGTAQHFQAMADPDVVIDEIVKAFPALKVLDEESGATEPEPIKAWIDIVRDELRDAVSVAIDRAIAGGDEQSERTDDGA